MAETGTLYLCATPIGNLGDMTYRAVETLRAANLVAAEDTRHTRTLLAHYDIHVRVMSYHEHNKAEKGTLLIKELKAGKTSSASAMRDCPASPTPVPISRGVPLRRRSR